MAISPGSRFGPFEVTATLGEGGMGIVFRGRDSRLQRDVALKLLPDNFASDPDRMSRFQREAQVLASLNHPNIAQVCGSLYRRRELEFRPRKIIPAKPWTRREQPVRLEELAYVKPARLKTVTVRTIESTIVGVHRPSLQRRQPFEGVQLDRSNASHETCGRR